RPVALAEGSRLYHYHLDHLGTPQEITDERGQLVWGVSYRAYGSVALAHELVIDNPLRFQGQYFDEESGLHYNRFRYYDPACGRFINQDPIGLAGGINNYQYVPNPIHWIDPLGLTAEKESPSRQAEAIGSANTFKNVVFAGHGSLNPGRTHKVPDGTSLTVYSIDGATISDRLGQAIEKGDDLSG